MDDLRATINDIIGGAQDADVQRALVYFFHDLPDDQKPDAGLIIDQMAELVILSDGNISPREAIIRMAEAKWDYQAAVSTYRDEPEDGSSSILSSWRGGERNWELYPVRRGPYHGSDDTGEQQPEFLLPVCATLVSL